MFETVVIATDSSDSAKRGVRTALDLAERFDTTVHALYVVDTGELERTPARVQDDLRTAIEDAGEQALSFVREQTTTDSIQTAIREGTPETEIIRYANEVDADLIALGTRGRHGDHAFLLGSVAEAVVREAPMPVLTARQLEQESPI